MKRSTRITLVTILAGGLALSASAAEKKDVHKVIQDHVKDKSKVTGTLDIFDSDADKVRNLKMLEFHDGVAQDGMNYTVCVDFRDNSTGDIVDVDFVVLEADGSLEVREYSIHKITENTMKEEMANKTYTDEDIQNVMKSYLDQKSKFTGTFDIYDEQKGKMLKLEFVDINPEIRKFGKLNISTVNFKDSESGNPVKIDLTVENNNGALAVKTVRIKND
jgi:hypothetical protein